MIRLLLLLVFVCLGSISLIAQDPDDYTNECFIGINEFPDMQDVGFESVIAYFNDDNADCISNDFLLFFFHPNGITELWHNNGDGGKDPGDNGDAIDFGQFDCCDDISGSGGGGGGSGDWATGFGSTGGWNGGIQWPSTGSGGCDCVFQTTGGTVTVTCPCINNSENDQQ